MAGLSFLKETVRDLDLATRGVPELVAEDVKFVDLRAEAATIRAGALTRCRFFGGSFQDAALGVTFSDCSFADVVLVGISGAKFSHCTFARCRIYEVAGATLDECSAKSSQLDEAVAGQMRETKGCATFRRGLPATHSHFHYDDSPPPFRRAGEYMDGGAGAVHLRLALCELERCRDHLLKDGLIREGKALRLQRILHRRNALGLSEDERAVCRYLLGIDRAYTGLVWPRFDTVAAHIGLPREKITSIVKRLYDRGLLCEYITKPPVDAVSINYDFEI